ncbi:MAG: twin transmembrane helix small protein [Alphaproteobacteria bacterium]|nr:twin transmembrane helix small protein [Alphaproteobacteria bacterium]
MTFELILKILLMGALIATVGSLILGLLTLFKEGKEADERSNKMMRLRIFFQALAILIFSLLLFLKGKSHAQNATLSLEFFIQKPALTNSGEKPFLCVR